MRNTLFFSLGSNIEPRINYLKKAICLLNKKFKLIKISPIYETMPVECNLNRPFLNMCAEYETDEIDPFKILEIIEEIEVSIGRKKDEKGKKVDREIDIDILFFNNIKISEKRLTIPHKDMFKRLFVLKPLLDILDSNSPYIKEYFLFDKINKIKDQIIKKVEEIEIEL